VWTNDECLVAETKTSMIDCLLITHNLMSHLYCCTLHLAFFNCTLTFSQVSQVYESIQLSRLVELAPFATTTDLEKVVVETATSNNIQVRVDHATG
jgi:hypothetical protein